MDVFRLLIRVGFDKSVHLVFVDIPSPSPGPDNDGSGFYLYRFDFLLLEISCKRRNRVSAEPVTVPAIERPLGLSSTSNPEPQVPSPDLYLHGGAFLPVFNYSPFSICYFLLLHHSQLWISGLSSKPSCFPVMPPLPPLPAFARGDPSASSSGTRIRVRVAVSYLIITCWVIQRRVTFVSFGDSFQCWNLGGLLCPSGKRYRPLARVCLTCPPAVSLATFSDGSRRHSPLDGEGLWATASRGRGQFFPSPLSEIGGSGLLLE